MDFIAAIREHLAAKDVKVPRFADATGIPKNRIYKWLDGKGKPKKPDEDTLRKYLNLKDDNPGIRVVSLQAKYEQAIEDKVKILEEHNKFLQAVITGSLQQILDKVNAKG